MKSLKVVLFFLVYLCVYNQNVSSQKFHLGVKTGVYDYYYYGDGIVGNWLVEAYTPVSIGKVVGVNLRYDFRYAYIESNISFKYNVSTLYLTNLTPDIEYEGEKVFTTKGGINQRDLNIDLLIGPRITYKKFIFRGYLGLNPTVFIKPNNMFLRPWDEINRCIFNSYESINVFGNYGIGIDYWRFSFDIKRENNLTPLIKSVDFEGKTYDYRLDTKRLFFMIGFNFYPWKKAD